MILSVPNTELVLTLQLSSVKSVISIVQLNDKHAMKIIS